VVVAWPWEGTSRVSVNEALRIVRGRWRIVVLCLLLALAAAGVATYLTPREYSSDVTLYVALQGRADSSDAAYQASQIAKDRVTSYAPLITDERVTQPVVDQLQLGMTPAQLASHITVTSQPDTVVLSAAVTDTSPDRSAAIANAVAQQFVDLVGQLEQPFGPTPAAAPGQPAPEPTKIGVTIIRPAVANPVPVSPNVPINLAVGAALGLLVGIAAAFVSNARDTRVRSAERLRALTGAPVLAEIPGDRDARLHPLTLGAASGSARVEAFRKLRTNLQFPEGGRPHRAVVVTSATVGEGKSTTACNLALALADSGCRVLLVDLNLRRPDVDRYLQMEPGAGAANVLAGRIAFHRAVMRWVEGGLDVLPAGPVPVNPSELLTSRAMGALLDEVRAKYDFVILDTPAILPVTDAAAVAARADGAVLVVRHGRTSEEEVAGAVSGLEAVGAKLLGVAVAGGPSPRRRLRRSTQSYPEPYSPSPQPRPASPMRTDVDPPTIQVPIVKLGGQDAVGGPPATVVGAGGDGAAADGAEHTNGSSARPSPSPRP
jgi:polysaccharide biosynthesis transport protein